MTTSSDPVVILRVGVEGGDVSVLRVRTSDATSYVVVWNEVAMHELLELLGDEPAGHAAVTHTMAPTLTAALFLLDRDASWPLYRVIEVHPDYADEILRAVEERLLLEGEPAGPKAQVALDRWRATVQTSRSP